MILVSENITFCVNPVQGKVKDTQLYLKCTARFSLV